MLAPPELHAVHPLGKSPVITDGAHTIAETGAIVEYLIGTYGDGRLIPPAGTEERLRYTYWLHFAEGSAMPPLVMTLVFGALPARVPFFIRPVAKLISDNVQKSFLRPNIEAQLKLMEAELGKSTWFAGDELHRCGRDDELPGGGGRYPRRPGRFAETEAVAGHRARASGLPGCAEARRPIRLRVGRTQAVPL